MLDDHADLSSAEPEEAWTAHLARMRTQYRSSPIDPDLLAPDPMVQFGRWLDEADAMGLPEPNAMVLSTASICDDGAQPSSRHVLVKIADEGMVFFTNHGSGKARDLERNARAAGCFPWFAMGRQVCLTGRVSRVDRATSQSYWSVRPRDAQLGAWASHQSKPVADRLALESRLDEMADRFAGADVPLPDFWGGFRLRPETMEFWQGQPGRLHDRFRYVATGAGWEIRRLQP